MGPGFAGLKKKLGAAGNDLSCNCVRAFDADLRIRGLSRARCWLFTWKAVWQYIGLLRHLHKAAVLVFTNSYSFPSPNLFPKVPKVCFFKHRDPGSQILPSKPGSGALHSQIFTWPFFGSTRFLPLRETRPAKTPPCRTRRRAGRRLGWCRCQVRKYKSWWWQLLSAGAKGRIEGIEIRTFFFVSLLEEAVCPQAFKAWVVTPHWFAGKVHFLVPVYVAPTSRYTDMAGSLRQKGELDRAIRTMERAVGMCTKAVPWRFGQTGGAGGLVKWSHEAVVGLASSSKMNFPIENMVIWFESRPTYTVYTHTHNPPPAIDRRNSANWSLAVSATVCISVL